MFSYAVIFIRRLTIRKLLNILLVQLSYVISNLLKRPLVWGKPWFISIEPASVCNLSCPQCPVGQGDISRAGKFMDLNVYKKFIKEISDTTAMLSLYFQGEPLMHKEFTEFVSIANSKNIFTQTSTNAQLLNEYTCSKLVEAGLDRIIISLDGADQESYQRYRNGGDLKKVEEGIRMLKTARQDRGSKTPFIFVQFLVFRHNQNQAAEVKKMAYDWGADRVLVKSARIEYEDSANEWIPDGTARSRYIKNDAGELKLRGKLRNRCKRLWQTTVLTSDGLIVPCCFDKRAVFAIAAKEEENFRQIWKSKSYQDFRRKVLSERKSIAICTNCSEGRGRIIF